MPIAKRCLIAGRVQGVLYRASAQREAQRLGIKGYAKNLPDGRVEVLAVGEVNAVDALIEWLWQGPPSARVTHVDVVDLSLDELVEIPEHFLTK